MEPTRIPLPTLQLTGASSAPSTTLHQWMATNLISHGLGMEIISLWDTANQEAYFSRLGFLHHCMAILQHG